LAKRSSFPPLRGYLLSVFPSSHTFSTRRENSELDASSSSYSSWAGEEEDHLPPDKIHLNDLQFHAYHGVLPSEKSLGQKFLINVEMKKKRRNTLSAFDTETPTPSEATEEVLKAHDRIEHTVDYAKAFTLIKSIVVSGPQRDLIETVGEDIAWQILRQFASVDEVKVSVEKPHVAIDGDLRSLGISLVRRRRKP
jgi:7,8-dihydroneopterin aldolase/epimerase/oxygenase